jgi:hypothetical protein
MSVWMNKHGELLVYFSYAKVLGGYPFMDSENKTRFTALAPQLWLYEYLGEL